jgi:hypothetical protein
MTQAASLKIDGYTHISPPRYTEALRAEFPGFYEKILAHVPPLFDMDARFKVIDAIEAMEITPAEKQMIFGGNAARLLRLDV